MGFRHTHHHRNCAPAYDHRNCNRRTTDPIADEHDPDPHTQDQDSHSIPGHIGDTHTVSANRDNQTHRAGSLPTARFTPLDYKSRFCGLTDSITHNSDTHSAK